MARFAAIAVVLLGCLATAWSAAASDEEANANSRSTGAGEERIGIR